MISAVWMNNFQLAQQAEEDECEVHDDHEDSNRPSGFEVGEEQREEREG